LVTTELINHIYNGGGGSGGGAAKSKYEGAIPMEQ